MGDDGKMIYGSISKIIAKHKTKGDKGNRYNSRTKKSKKKRR